MPPEENGDAALRMAAAGSEPGAETNARPSLAVFLDLTKPRLAFLSTLTGLAGYLAAPSAFEWLGLLAVTVAVFLSGAGALALNQWMEHRTDALMERTRDRPLPTGRISRPAAFGFGVAVTASGIALSAVFLPLLSTALIAVTVAVYLLAYTPLKKRTCWCTHVGALPGALPPLIGWTAATGSIGGLGAWLFAILLLWQMPHFFAIAWLCRDDYERGGLRVLSVTHPDGKRLLRENYLYLLLLFPVCLAPTLASQTGWIYGASSLLLNLLFLFEGIRFAATVRSGGRTGNRLFLYSLLYLPLLLLILLFDRTFA